MRAPVPPPANSRDTFAKLEELHDYGRPPALGPGARLTLEAPPGEPGETLYLAEPVTLPDGRKAFIHPYSLEEEQWINVKAAKGLRGLLKADPQLEETSQRLWLRREAWVWQVLCVTRQSAAAGSPRTLRIADEEWLRRDPAWTGTLKFIAATSEALTADGASKRSLTEILSRVLVRLDGILARFGEGKGAECQPDLERLAGEFLQWRARQDLGPDLFADPVPEPEN
jgi:hypothetical protein